MLGVHVDNIRVHICWVIVACAGKETLRCNG